MTDTFWNIDPDIPFGTLITVAEIYCHPEAYEEAYDDLKNLAKREDDKEMRTFKDELRKAVLDPGLLPPGKLRMAIQFDDGTDENFLRRLWRDLYPDEPVPAEQ